MAQYFRFLLSLVVICSPARLWSASEPPPPTQEVSVHQVRRLNQQVEALQAQGDSEETVRLAREAVQLAELMLPVDSLDRATALNNLGVIVFGRGDYGEARRLHERALTIRRKQCAADDPALAQSLNNLGAIYRAQKEYQPAEQMFRAALAIYERGPSSQLPLVATTLNNLAALSYTTGDLSRAQQLYERALAIRKDALPALHPDLAQSLNNLGLLYNRQRDYPRAKPLLQAALDIYERTLSADHPAVAVTLHNLALLAAAMGDRAQAVTLLARVADLRERQLTLILAGGSEEQKLAYLSLLSGDIDATVSLHLRMAPHDPRAQQLACTTLLRRKGRALDAMVQAVTSLRRSLSTADQRVFDELAEARTQLATVMLRTLNGVVVDEPQRAALEVRRNRVQMLEQQLSTRSTAFQREVQPVTISEVQMLIPAQAALIEFVAYRPFTPERAEDRWGVQQYAAYILRHDGEVQWVDLGAAQPIEQNLAAWRAAVIRKDHTRAHALARSLDEQLMRPLRAKLRQATFFIISPADALHLLPFAALVDEEGQYLLERYTFVYVTSGRDLRVQQQTAPLRGQPVIIANPTFMGEPRESQVATPQTTALSALQFPPLPETAEEARALHGLLQHARLLTDVAATETAVKQLRGPRLLHFATHGFFLPASTEIALRPRHGEVSISREKNLRLTDGITTSPLSRSGLALAGVNQPHSGADDGLLTALEAAGLDLWGTRLVTLSACETGLGDVRNGEGVYGLRRAIAMAGAESQLMSLWKVADTATRTLMVNYYTQLRGGMTRAEGLRKVQLEMLHGRDYTAPFYWASFILSGAWTAIEGI